jgi:hypothetical protein
MGAHLNAYTSREQTVYYAKCFSKDVPRGELFQYFVANRITLLNKPTKDIMWFIAILEMLKIHADF